MQMSSIKLLVVQVYSSQLKRKQISQTNSKQHVRTKNCVLLLYSFEQNVKSLACNLRRLVEFFNLICQNNQKGIFGDS